MMDVPATRYADTERGAIAFQVVGDGPLTILVNKLPGLPVDLMWEEPSLARFMTGLGSFSRSIWFDPLARVHLMPLRRLRTGLLRESSPTWRACSMLSTVNAPWFSAWPERGRRSFSARRIPTERRHSCCTTQWRGSARSGLPRGNSR